MKTRITTIVKTFTNPKTGEKRTRTVNHMAHINIECQKWNMLDQECLALKRMRYKSQQNLYRLESFEYSIYGE